MGEDRWETLSTSYKTISIEYGGTTARGVTSRVVFHFRIKDPLPNNHPYTTPPTQLPRGGVSFLGGWIYSTISYHLPSSCTVPFFLRGAWVIETPASKFLSCSGMCSHGRAPSRSNSTISNRSCFIFSMYNNIMLSWGAG